MQSNLRQHMTSQAKDIITLGGPPHRRGDDRGRARPAPKCSSQERNKKHVYTLKPLNTLLRPTAPHKTPALEHRNSSAIARRSGSRQIFVGGRESLSDYNEPMGKVQFNNHHHHHLNNNRSCQSASRKNADFQRQRSYDKQKEFALALCKQLNDNLKVGRPMQIASDEPQMPSVLSPFSSSAVSENSKPSAPPTSLRRLSLDSSVHQRSQQSVEKMDKRGSGDHSSPSLSQGEQLHHQATTPVSGRSLSLKRRRTISEDCRGEEKRLCQKEVGLTPTSSGSFSQCSSPPNCIKRAFLKTSDDPVLTLNEKCSPTLNGTADEIKTSTTVAKQLFQEPRTESDKLQTTTTSTVVHGTGHQKDDLRRSTEDLLGTSATADTCPSLSSKPNHKQGEDSLPVSSHTSSLSSLTDKKTNSPVQQSIDIALHSPDAKDSHNSKAITGAKKDAEDKRDLVWKDPLDVEFGEEEDGLASCVLSLSSSHSSEEDHMLSLKEILERSSCLRVTLERATLYEPSTPGPKVYEPKAKVTDYKNTLENMLKEKEQNQKSKELEMHLLQSCKEDLLKLDEEDENAEEGLSHEQREFLERFSFTSCVIRDTHPGEELFTLSNSGRLFNHQSLSLRKMNVTPNNRPQQTLLQAHSEQLLLLLSAGLFKRAYSSSPCQPQVTHWLFQMMSVHPDPITCAQILQAMTTIALSAAQQIVEKSNKRFEVWVPSIKDVALVFLNMGVSFVNLFSLEDLQPAFTEGDLLESLEIQPDDINMKEGDTFPEHNFENIIKYLALCAALCPRAYSDEELLLLLTVVCKVSLETRLQLLPTGDLTCLLQHLLNNMTDWKMQLSKVCQAITNLSEDHHNLRRLIQLLPHNWRGKQLRRHASVSIISKLLNDRCNYTPSCTEFQLSDLRCYLPRMRPSLLLKRVLAEKTTEPQETEDCTTTPDQQAYYLCYSLLALTNEASNFEFLPSNQRNELLLLSAELEKHIKCDIRESEKMLYRSKVKDFLARIYTKWQVLLQRSRPQEGKLYDYWKPLPEVETTTKTEQDDTDDPLSDESDIVQSDVEEPMEVKDEEPTENEEKPEDGVENILEKIEEIQEVATDVKEEQSLMTLDDDDDDAEEITDDMAIDELLRESCEGSGQSDEDEDLFKREDELLNDDESVDRIGDRVGGENDDSEKLELFGKHFYILDETSEELLLAE